MEANLIIFLMEDSLNILVNERQPKISDKQILHPKTIEIKTMVVAQLRVA